MSFQTGLSGLNASSKNLDVIGNNIANANTVGMKTSRAEFADIVASTLGSGGSANNPGIGVSVATIAQMFTQGNISITGNNLDVAINGGGFFQVQKTDGTTAYTRDGQFKLDKDGNIINNTGSFLMGYPTDVTGTSTSRTPQPLTVPTGAPIAANKTSEVVVELNLDSRVLTPAQITAAGSTPPPLSTYGTSLTTYDSQGNELPVSFYFQRLDATDFSTTATTDKWAVYTDSSVGSTPVAYMAFNSTGALHGVYTKAQVDAANLAATSLGTNTGDTLPITILNPSHPTAGDVTVNVDLSSVTQFGVNFAVSNLSQDGYTSGEFTGLSIDPKGVITTRYSNGQTLLTGGMIALGDFRNLQGLAPIGGGEYLETYKSGPVVLGEPTSGRFGELRAGAVEDSNVDLTSELVNMMTAQRNYQANAQTIKTQDQVMSTLVNLR